MKKYILALAGILMLQVAAIATPVDRNEWDLPSKLDSLLSLNYNPQNYTGTVAEITKLDKVLGQKIDSAIKYVNSLSSTWAMAPVYQYRMYNLIYRQLVGYVVMVKQEYGVFNKIESEYPKTTPADPRYQLEVDKPVIYLYPTKETKINVSLGFKGADLYTWPKIEAKNNWNVTAQPDGMLKDAAGEEYPYLFWEGKMDNFNWVDMNEGFVVPFSETETFFRDKLKFLGLNSREYTDFITFWAPKMQANPYNFIRFETTAYIGEVPLTVTPQPESSQRILMVYKGLEEPITVKEQVLKPFTRKGYTLIEWGGTTMPTIVN